jgi:hypothetical protein
MKKTLLVALTLILAIGAVTAVFAAQGNDQPSPTITRAASSDPRQADDRRADDTRRADDDRRADDNGVTDDRMRGEQDDVDEPGEVEVGEDISGPCDEAEHATDPRCTGVAGPQADDEVAEPVDDDVVEDDDAVDNSGPGSLNSGPGSLSSGPSATVDDDGGEGGNSGPGGGESGDSH